MKLKEAIRRAVERNDVIMFGQVLDQLRSVGFSYNRSCDFAQKNIPDFNIRKRIEGNYEVTEIPYYELELGIKIITKPGEKVRSTYQSNSITSSEFNK